jgi:hypothetical protein
MDGGAQQIKIPGSCPSARVRGRRRYFQENQNKMQSIWKSKGKKLHTRNIEVTTYDYDGQRIIVEGFLRDDRFQESHVITGETFPNGVIHHMAIRLLVNCSNLLIEDVDVDMRSVPREVCRETIDCLAPIKGLTITKGFTSKVKKLAGAIKDAPTWWSSSWQWPRPSFRDLAHTNHKNHQIQILIMHK